MSDSQISPCYSICMCNYNMADTLEASLGSLLPQLDERFEVLVVDDGSSDNSLAVLKKLQQGEPRLRVVALERDPRRKLGMTRNISIREAHGEYVLLHLDCDDIFEQYVADFIEVFHAIENCLNKNVLLSGAHINMAKRTFLLTHGPYQNIYRGEDKDLWSRLAAEAVWIPLNHKDFITRLKRKMPTQVSKKVKDTFDHMRNEFLFGTTVAMMIKGIWKCRKHFSRKMLMLRFALTVPTWLTSLLDPPLPALGQKLNPEDFLAYRLRHQGTVQEILMRNGCDGNLDFLRPEARAIFLQAVRLWDPNRI